MLKRLYVDNHKCFVNFEIKPGPLTLLLGPNGGGKSSVFEVLASLRDFALGVTDAATAFPLETRTRWESRGIQTFEVNVTGPAGEYLYQLCLEPWGRPANCRVTQETLALDGRMLFEFVQGEVHLYKDDYTRGPDLQSDWFRSSLARVHPGPSNAKLTWFKDWLKRLWIVAPNPRVMASETRADEEDPSRELANFASWYAHSVQEYPNALADHLESLRSVIGGFQELVLKRSGEQSRTLKLSLSAEPGDAPKPSTSPYRFDELSDGQRMLIGLYALLHFGRASGATLCIDEPDNFVALAEIQPWLIGLRDCVEETKGQALLVSHHPEVINYFAPTSGLLLVRESGGPTRVRDFTTDPHSGLSAAEMIARGWE